MDGSFEVSGVALRGAVALVARAAFRKTSMPVLASVRLTANGGVTVEATDLENRLSVQLVRMGGEGEVSVLLPAERLAKFAKTLPEGPCPVEREGFRTRFGGTSSIEGLDPADFPSTGQIAWEESGTVAAEDVAGALRSTSFARSKEAVRYALTGTLVEFGQGKTGHVVASDGKRLSAVPVRRRSAGKGFRAILSTKGADLLLAVAGKFARGSDVAVEIARAEKGDEVREIRFRAGSATLVTRAVEGRFPDWEAIVPGDDTFGDAVWKARPGDLAAALAAVSIAVSEKTPGARFTFGPDRISVLAKSADLGEARSECSARGAGAGEVSVGFNPGYVLDYLESLPKGTQEVEIRTRGKDHASTWKSAGPKGAVYVLMPVSVNF